MHWHVWAYRDVDTLKRMPQVFTYRTGAYIAVRRLRQEGQPARVFVCRDQCRG